MESEYKLSSLKVGTVLDCEPVAVKNLERISLSLNKKRISNSTVRALVIQENFGN